MIEFPVRAEKGDDARFAYLVDADGRILFGGGSLEDAEQLVTAANAGANPVNIPKPVRRKNKREQAREELRNSDPLARLMGRDDEIEYGLPDELPQCGDLVARLSSKAR